MKTQHKHNKFFLLVALSLLFALSFVHANDDDLCVISAPPGQGTASQGTYDITTNPSRISSASVGFVGTACGAASLSSGVDGAAPLDAKGNPETQQNIINACVKAGGVTATQGGKIDDYIIGITALFNQDPTNCFRITLKRVDSFTQKPIVALPQPTRNVKQNVEILTYRPYNFRVSDLIEAMKNKPTLGKTGVAMAGVAYDPSNTVTDAHMVLPVALESQGHKVGIETRHAIKVYDPYFGKDIPVDLAFDNDSRMYSNLWNRNGNDIWFHLEDLVTLENLGPCVNLTVNNTHPPSSAPTIPIRGPSDPPGVQPVSPITGGLPYTPIIVITPRCGDKVITPPEECDDGNRVDGDGCSAACVKEFCGDKKVQAALGEQCDDGNKNSNDGCSASCKIEARCGSVWMLKSAMECEDPGSVCFRVSHGSIAKGICSADCACNLEYKEAEVTD